MMNMCTAIVHDIFHINMQKKNPFIFNTGLLIMGTPELLWKMPEIVIFNLLYAVKNYMYVATQKPCLH